MVRPTSGGPITTADLDTILQRRRVEMVEVQVGDEHRVDVTGGRGVGQGAVAAQGAGPAPQRRVGEDADAVHLDEDRPVPHVGHARLFV